MAQRITLMATLTGLIAVLMGILPTASNRLSAAPNSPGVNTAAHNTTMTVAPTVVDLLPLAVLALAAGAIISSTGILKAVK